MSRRDKKVHGSGKARLIYQFLTETTILSFMAAIIGVIIAYSILPWFSKFMNLSQILKIDPAFLLLIVPCILFLGFLAGIYPAFFLSSIKEISMLKASSQGRLKGKNIRHFLMVFQFFISITLISLTFLIDRQVSYIRDKDIGIDKTNVVYAKLPLTLIRGNKEVFTERISKLPNVEKVAYSSRMLGSIDGYNTLEINGKFNKFTTMWVDAAFIDFYDLELLEGRFFSDKLIADVNATALLNEAALREFDAKDPFEIEIKVPRGSAKVVGIVKDFNFKSLHHGIEPLAIIYLPGQGTFANIRISSHNIPATLDEISEIWTELAPGFPFSYHFLDSRFDELYKQDTKMGKAITMASMIAIIIAVLGVMSLSLFVCESRRKEIALRKVNGAKIAEVIFELNKGFAYNLIIAFTLSLPVAWYIMRLWLDNFAYKTNISHWIFIFSGVIVFIITLTIVSLQSWRFANRNPVDSLRCE